MNTVPLVSGTSRTGTVSFFPDDTVESVRQRVALGAGSHPDRLYIQVKAVLPADYYSSDPRRWTALFLRMSYDGKTVRPAELRVYNEQIRPGTAIPLKKWTLEEWETHEGLEEVFDPKADFEEWRVLGVENSFVMPLPPRDLPELKSTLVPLPQPTRLMENVHPYEISEIRATVAENPSQIVKLTYFPFLSDTTPVNLENLRGPIESSLNQLDRLLKLETDPHDDVHVLRTKWYVPWVSTRFSAATVRFEQIFYGMTVSETVPYIGYFTGKDEVMRHKFYVKDPKTKKPFLDIPVWKSWLSTTQPQRRLPTLLFYEGKDRNTFNRISVTSKDITVSTFRSKDAKNGSPEELKTKMREWMNSFDALLPFVKLTDLEPSRWKLNEMTLVAFYKRELKELDRRRFPCIQNLFSPQDASYQSFRFLRAENAQSAISPQELQAYQILNQDENPSAELLKEEMNLSDYEAERLFARVRDLSEDINLDQEVKGYPSLTLGRSEITITYATNLERMLRYADLLRYVLDPASESSDLDTVCPRRMEAVEPVAVEMRPVPEPTEVPDEELEDVLGMFGGAKPSKIKVEGKKVKTYNYFNLRLQSFDPALFDKTVYPEKCEKGKQVVVLTPEDQARIPALYNYSDAPPEEVLPLPLTEGGPAGIAICPPFWCMTDNLPLREEQLETDADGDKSCPVCHGKVRKTDKEDQVAYSVIARNPQTKYPDLTKTGNFPCCYKVPRQSAELKARKTKADTTDDTYVLDATRTPLPELRMGYLSDELAESLRLKTEYNASAREGRLIGGKSDIFRVGLGRPSKTLPELFKGSLEIKNPVDAPDKVKLCSFYRTWSTMGKGTTEEERILDGINTAYKTGSLAPLDELEYVTTFLRMAVWRVVDGMMTCGFWADVVEPGDRTILLVDTDILVRVTRRPQKTGPKFEYEADITKILPKDSFAYLQSRHSESCSVNLPTFENAIAEIVPKPGQEGKTSYEIINDPFTRAQAIFVPREILLPFRPATIEPLEGVPVRSGYSDIPAEEFPTGDTARAFLEKARHPGFKVVASLQNVAGKVVELLLASGFRVPIQPEDAPVQEPAREVLETIYAPTEATLVSGEPNKQDITKARDIAYVAEMTEFLMYSLSKDLRSGEYDRLKKVLEKQDEKGVAKELDKWMTAEAHWMPTDTPTQFINKVRTPCGQFDNNKDACTKSSLCGWYKHKDKNVCKIRVRPIVDRDTLLRRLVKTLVENDKQRALVLDERLSPFFSTILYLEMPHEWITTVV